MDTSKKYIQKLDHSTSIIEQFNFGIWEWNIEDNTIYVNEEFCNIIGFTIEEICQYTFDEFFELFDVYDKNFVLDFINNSQNFDVHECDKKIKHKDGNYLKIHEFTKIIDFYEDKRPKKIIGIVQLTSKSFDIETAIAENEQNFKNFFDTLPDFLIITDENGKAFYINPAVTSLLGYTLEDFQKNSILIIRPQDKHLQALRTFQELKAGEKSICTLPVISKEGYIFPVETKMYKGKWNNQNAYFVYIRDLSKEEEALQKFNKTFDLNPTMMSLIDYETRKYVDVNKAFVNLIGLPYEDIIDKTPQELKLCCDEKVFEYLNKKIEIEKKISNYEVELCLKNGKKIIGLFSCEIIEIQYRKYILQVITDITERKLIEKALVEQTRLQEILMDVANTFINIPIEKSDEAINEALALLGEFTNTDRAYVFEYDHENRVCNNTYEWCSEGTTPEIENLQGVPFDAIPQWVETHFAGKIMYIPNVYALQVGDPIREILEPQNIKSLLALPMMDRDKCIGFVGFDAVKNYHNFSEKEQKLLQLFSLMLVNLSNRIKAQKELTIAMENAKAANVAKSQFLANMSHEIRTPLNAVIGFTDLLKDTELTPVQKEYVQSANTAGQALLGIINDILDFSKIEAGMLQLECVKTDVIELISNTIDIIRPQAEKKNIELLLNYDVDLPRFAIVDPIRLKQILVNLLSNAIKFTEKGEVELKVEHKKIAENKATFHFSVRDTGIGISDEQKTKLFKAFSQADSSTTRKYGGTGLGLVISDLLAKKMGSKIELESQVGIGSIFSFELLLDVEDGKKHSLAEIKFNYALIIDDNQNNRKILSKYLDNLKINYVEAENALDALQKYEENKDKIDLILCDYHMPYIDGIETIKMLQQRFNINNNKQPVIILHSSSSNAEFFNKCDEIGVKFRITKPVKFEDLVNCFYNFLDSKSDDMSAKTDNDTDVKSCSLQKIKILVVEDVYLNMKLILNILNKLEYKLEILQAENGQKGIEIYLQNNPDIILMDVQMPELDGISATKKIREIEKNTSKRTCIIALTAGALKEERDACIEAGMDDFITKPIEKNRVIEIIKKYNKYGFYFSDELHFNAKELLNTLSNDVDMLEELKNDAVSNIKSTIDELQNLIEILDYNNLAKKAHTIKGISLNMKFNLLSIYSKKLEDAAKNNYSQETLLSIFEKIKEEWGIVNKILNVYNDYNT